MCKLQTCEIYVIDLKLDMSTRRLQTLRLASNGPFGAPTLYNIKEYNNPRLLTNNDNIKHDTDENNYVIMKIDNKAHTCNDGYGLLFFKR